MVQLTSHVTTDHMSKVVRSLVVTITLMYINNFRTNFSVVEQNFIKNLFHGPTHFRKIVVPLEQIFSGTKFQ